MGGKEMSKDLLPSSQSLETLEKMLQYHVAREEYELAADIKKQLDRLKDPSQPHGLTMDLYFDDFS